MGSRLRGFDPREYGRREDDWSIEHLGTRAQLIEHGIVPDGNFPGDAGRPRTSYTFDSQWGRMSILRLQSNVWGERFWVYIAKPQGAKSKEEIANEAAQSFVPTEDDDYPPNVAHNKAVQRGNGDRWHYLAAADVMVLEGLLDEDEVPGSPACKYKWRTSGWKSDKIAFQAIRLGDKVALTLLAANVNLIRCPPLRFAPK